MSAFNFSGLDLSHIRVKYADLSQAICSQTNLEGADL
jgi:uncharacterized protein YjbI with pentapeptide repeats